MVIRDCPLCCTFFAFRVFRVRKAVFLVLACHSVRLWVSAAPRYTSLLPREARRIQIEETLAVMLAGPVNARSVNLTYLASPFPSKAHHSSNCQRLQRFFSVCGFGEGGYNQKLVTFGVGGISWRCRETLSILREKKIYRHG